MDTIPSKPRQRESVLRPTLAPAEVVASTPEQDQQIVAILTALIVNWLRDPQRARLLTSNPATIHCPDDPSG